MMEYRRFIAYFYEYIDGKKQKNAGFVKVELRNGMWRILFRLTAERTPEPPLQVYGFVRESGWLLGFPLGIMRIGREIAEEWAYGAEAPIGKEKYRLEDFAGIRIQSGDGRCFITVWDDEKMEPERFVLELPPDCVKERETQDLTAEVAAAEIEEAAPEEVRMEIEETAPEEVRTESREGEVTEESAGEMPDEVQTESHEGEVTEEVWTESREGEAAEEITEAAGSLALEESAAAEMVCVPRENCVLELFKKRQRFEPFDDRELVNCVQIMPCDIVRMQQEHWHVGRSSFLQHGYYQYRHLLLATTPEGRYIIGVPGLRSPQEKYMAQMFGFEKFKTSRIYECGRAFGYWYKELEEC